MRRGWLSRLLFPFCLDDPGGVPDPPPPPEPKPKKLECEHCGCQLAPDGRVMKYSDRAAELRDLEIKVSDLTRELAAERAEVARLKAETTPTAKPAETAGGGFRPWGT